MIKEIKLVIPTEAIKKKPSAKILVLQSNKE